MKEDTVNAMVDFIEATKAAIDESQSISDRAKQRVRTVGDELIGCLENEELPKQKS